jgi:uncharacterized membrane protein YjjB (DUF3815 family)
MYPFGRLTRMGGPMLIAAAAGIVGVALAGCHTASAASSPTPATASTPSTVSTGRTVAPSPGLSVPGTHKSTTVYQVSSPVSTVVVTSHAGDVTVIGGGSATSITQQADYSSTPPVTIRSINGGTLTVTYTCPVQLVCGVAYIIRVPRDVTVQAMADAGAIRLTGLAGRLTAKADVGFITATGLAGASVSLTTDVGGISARFTAAPATLEAVTKVGAITLRVPGSAAYKVSVDDHVGRATVSVRQSSSAPHAITAVTDVGDIHIEPLA